MIHVSTQILHVVAFIAEADDNPMNADEIAFLLDVPWENAVCTLRQLVADGTVKPDGGVFRLKRLLTATDIARIDRLHNKLKQLRTIVECCRCGFTVDDTRGGN